MIRVCIKDIFSNERKRSLIAKVHLWDEDTNEKGTFRITIQKTGISLYYADGQTHLPSLYTKPSIKNLVAIMAKAYYEGFFKGDEIFDWVHIPEPE